MSTFELNGIDPEKCFIIHKKDIEKRLDPFYYIPSIIELESKVKKLNPKPLRYYVKHISSGATPKTTEAEKYYSDAENGVPFLRVQNLSPSGLLELEECKYINWETHENYLKRSQVSGGDLLVKITGVGRMAVASAAPEGFVGNTNQHMVVIKTESKEASEILAAYLNTDIGEALASRRATGGTRPALDYPALLSIPIVYDKKILEIHREAIKIKEEKEAESEELLKSIDTYLLDELKITPPKIEDNLDKRIFITNFSEISGQRLDPDYYSNYYQKIEEAISLSFSPAEISTVVSLIKGGKTPAKDDYSDTETDFPIVKVGSYTKDFINLQKVDYVVKPTGVSVHQNDIFILSAAHQSEYVGRHIKFLNVEPEQKTGYVGELICIRTIRELCNPMYLFSLLNLDIYKTLLNREKTGQTSHIYGKDIKKIKIPLPPIEKQNEIADNIQTLRDRAKELQDEAIDILENAKKEVEKMILGE